MNRRHLIYSICIAVAVTAVSYFFYTSVGEHLAFPGMLIEVYITGLILLTVSSGDTFYTLPPGSFWVFNVVFYAVIVYVVLRLTAGVRSSRRA